jgi:WD40 repeat protein
MLMLLSTLSVRSASVETLMRVPPTQIVESMLFSPDGKAIATLRYQGTVFGQHEKLPVLQLWAVPQGTLLWTAAAPVSRLLAFSREGALLAAVGEDERLTVWDTRTGKEKQRLPLDDGGLISRAAFLADAQTLVVAVDQFRGPGVIPMAPTFGEIQLHKTKSGRLIRTLKAYTNAISALVLSPDGKTLAVASDRSGPKRSDVTVALLDLRKDSVLHSMHFATNVWIISSLAFSFDGKTLAVGAGTHAGDGQITLWDVAIGRLQKTIADESGVVTRISYEPFLAFSPDGQILASVGENQSVILWNTITGKWKNALGGAEPPLSGRYAIHFDGKGLLLARANDCQQVEVQFWDYKGK